MVCHLLPFAKIGQKAFDTTDHRTLLYKLDNYGVRGITLSWLKSYLSNRQQFVFIDGFNSTMSNTQCGVSQSSILIIIIIIIVIYIAHNNY